MSLSRGRFTTLVVSAAWKSGLLSRVAVGVGEVFGSRARRYLLVLLGTIPGYAVELANAVETHARNVRMPRAIDRIPLLSEDAFNRRYGLPGVPAVIVDPIQAAALEHWSFDYLEAAYGNIELSARKGGDYDRLARERIELSDYIRLLFSGGTDFYLANNPVPLPMRSELSLPPYYQRKFSFRDAQLWIGGSGTGAHLHRDMVDNFLCQIIGSKRIYLCAPDETERLYTWEVHGGLVSSKVDISSPNLMQYPLVKAATILEVTLRPGETLYVPCGWFHQVSNLTNSCSVNFFGRFPSVAALPELEARLLSQHLGRG